ncbi:MAG: chemotaxis protein CheD [Gemmatimonadaceae bacterium]
MTPLATPRASAVIPRQSPAQRLTPDRTIMLPQVYLHPGQTYVTTDASAITTILGSCVAVCLFDARAKIGGINHFLLPDQSSDPATLARYGPSATQLLLDQMIALGARAETMTARLVGGANVLSAFRVNPPLGERNALSAEEVLTAAGVLVSSRDVGGTNGRKLVFLPCEGTTFVKLIGR